MKDFSALIRSFSLYTRSIIVVHSWLLIIQGFEGGTCSGPSFLAVPIRRLHHLLGGVLTAGMEGGLGFLLRIVDQGMQFWKRALRNRLFCPKFFIPLSSNRLLVLIMIVVQNFWGVSGSLNCFNSLKRVECFSSKKIFS